MIRPRIRGHSPLETPKGGLAEVFYTVTDLSQRDRCRIAAPGSNRQRLKLILPAPEHLAHHRLRPAAGGKVSTP